MKSLNPEAATKEKRNYQQRPQFRSNSPGCRIVLPAATNFLWVMLPGNCQAFWRKAAIAGI
jgi:hypothetical protein